MADVIFPKHAPMPRELDSRPILDDYRPRKVRMRASDSVDVENYQSDELQEDNHLESSSRISSQINLPKLEHELTRNPLNEIATMVRSLTYGEMMELAQAIWRIRPEGADVDQDSLPMLLHRWSTSSEH